MKIKNVINKLIEKIFDCEYDTLKTINTFITVLAGCIIGAVAGIFVAPLSSAWVSMGVVLVICFLFMATRIIDFVLSRKELLEVKMKFISLLLDHTKTNLDKVKTEIDDFNNEIKKS